MADDQTPAQPGATTENPSDTPTEARGDTPTPATPDTGDAGGEAAGSTPAPRKKAAARKRPAKKAAPAEQPAPSGDAPSEAAPSEAAPSGSAGQEAGSGDQPPADRPPADKPVVKKTTRKRTTKKAAAAPEDPSDAAGGDSSAPSDDRPVAPTVLFQPPPAAPAPARRRKPATTADDADAAVDPPDDTPGSETGAAGEKKQGGARQGSRSGKGKTQGKTQGKQGQARGGQGPGEAGDDESPQPAEEEAAEQDDESQDDQDESGSEDGAPRRRRRRGGRRRRGKGGQDGDGNAQDDEDDDSDNGSDTSGDDSGDSGDSGDSEDGGDDSDQSSSSSSRRRRRRRRSGDGDDSSDGSDGSGTKVRSARAAEDEITSFTGSTRLEAKKQRRREGREAGRRRAPVISEAEFLARRESVNRKMVVRQRDDLTQIAVMEDKVLVEHYVARESQTSLIGNVYLGRVQNVLPSMEAAFIDIGRGRNAVLYAGEVNWDALGAGGGGKERKIEQVLKPGQSVLVQVSKDPIGHKGARLTSQISLPGRFLVYVPEGNTSGISRKLPDTERNRLKNLLKEIVPSEAGVIVRTAAEGAAEEELRRDVARLTARWEDIKSKVEGGNAPQELYSEPDLTLKVVRDLFTEDIGELVVSGADAWDMVSTYVDQVAPDLVERLTQHDDTESDAFSAYRIDEQIAKALERKVWLPSGGSLIIDRTEAMTVVDVNTGKFTGSGGNLEETVTKNNLEAAEEIVRQLRLRDIGGIIVIDFIDMVLESNRDLVLRRLIECLGRDRTRHQVAEVTSLGLVQMTRKRIGTGLLEAFSEQCEHCQGRGYHVHAEPVEQKKRSQEDDSRRGRRGRRGKSDEQDGNSGNSGNGGNGGNNRKGADERKTGTATNAANGGNGANNGNGDGDHGDNGVRRPTPAEFAAMAHRQAEADAADASTPDGQQQAEQQPEPEQQAEQQPEQQQAEQQPEQQQAEQQPEQAEQQPEQQQAEQQPEQQQAEQQPEQAEQPPVPEGPRIVTSTRRRGARRAAGPPRGEVSESPT